MSGIPFIFLPLHTRVLLPSVLTYHFDRPLGCVAIFYIHSADANRIESVHQGADESSDESGDEAEHSDESENESKTGDTWMRLWCWLRPTLRTKLQVIFPRCI